MSAEKGQILISIRQIVSLCDFAGIAIDHDNSVFADDEDQYDTEIIIEQNVALHGDDGEVIYQGIAAYFDELQSEGWCGLGTNDQENT